MSFLLQRIAINFPFVVFRSPVLHQQFFSFMIEHVNKLQHFIIDSITSIHEIKFLYQFYIHAHLWNLYIKLLILYIVEIVTTYIQVSCHYRKFCHKYELALRD